MLLRQIGLGAALESGRFDQASLDWYVSLLRDTHTMRNEFEASPTAGRRPCTVEAVFEHDEEIGYVHEGNVVVADPGRARHVPTRQEEAAIDAAEHCPGECIYLEVESPGSEPDDADIHDVDVVGDPI